MPKKEKITFTSTKLPSVHVKFNKEIVEKVYGPYIQKILEGPNPPTNVSQLAKQFQETYGVATAPGTVAEWLKILGLTPKTRVEWGTQPGDQV